MLYIRNKILEVPRGNLGMQRSFSSDRKEKNDSNSLDQIELKLKAACF